MRQAVLDATRRWVAEGWVDSWFFVRLSLGGHHLRIRRRVVAGVDPALPEALLRSVCEDFFGRQPSTDTIEAERIREHNAYVRRFDPTETDDTVYPDNSLQNAAFVPETERYGGPGLVDASFDYFCLSSLQVMHVLDTGPEPLGGRRLSLAFALLVRQVWGFAAAENEVMDLIAYPPSVEAVEAKADAAYERRPATYLALLKRELLQIVEDPHSATDPVPLVAGARCLREAIGSLPAAKQLHLRRSQLHMTSNRLGLENREETYLARLVIRAVKDLRKIDEEFWSRCVDLLSMPAAGADLPTLRSAALASSLEPVVSGSSRSVP